ncbi:ligand-effect modulator 3 family [Jimgerdemannia flammicorona]|uniref:Ligand-effect modulator 3 family n=1 Tax=Jimgerdemannia flammicorona TaxID=994334 RepID=A0A433D7C2_9FUNG|nr:ligand-effect modulator 3 family [Jimgerdemannia flammicorona]
MTELRNRRPANTAFKQQRLKNWQPLLTPKTVLPTLFIVGIIFAPLGGLFLYASESLNEITIDYTHCADKLNGTSLEQVPTGSWEYKFTSANITKTMIPGYRAYQTTSFLDNLPNPNNITVTRCVIEFSIPVPLNTPIFLYYRLTNFYQNHRKYVKSYDQAQLAGKGSTYDDIALDCAKAAGVEVTKAAGVEVTKTPYYPCGLIAASMFNDTIGNLVLLNPSGTSAGNITYNFSSVGIAWPDDKTRYKPPAYKPDEALPPATWALRYPNGTYTVEYPPPDLSLDEHFQVWMRTSWYPTFRKLWGKNTQTPMEAGSYRIEIDMNYPITVYGGTKSIVISGTSFLGTRSSFMGLAWITMGCICAGLGVIFLAGNCFKPRVAGRMEGMVGRALDIWLCQKCVDKYFGRCSLRSSRGSKRMLTNAHRLTPFLLRVGNSVTTRISRGTRATAVRSPGPNIRSRRDAFGESCKDLGAGQVLGGECVGK